MEKKGTRLWNNKSRTQKRGGGDQTKNGNQYIKWNKQITGKIWKRMALWNNRSGTVLNKEDLEYGNTHENNKAPDCTIFVRNPTPSITK